MAKHTYEAVFPSGEKVNRTTAREYAQAWRVYDQDGKTVVSGFSKSRQGAEEQARGYCRAPGRKYETAPTVIVTPVKRRSNIDNMPFRIERTYLKTGSRCFMTTGSNRHVRFATREEAEAYIQRRINELGGHADGYSFKITVK
jgi:hypothetical protein